MTPDRSIRDYIGDLMTGVQNIYRVFEYNRRNKYNYIIISAFVGIFMYTSTSCSMKIGVLKLA